MVTTTIHTKDPLTGIELVTGELLQHLETVARKVGERLERVEELDIHMEWQPTLLGDGSVSIHAELSARNVRMHGQFSQSELLTDEAESKLRELTFEFLSLVIHDSMNRLARMRKELKELQFSGVE